MSQYGPRHCIVSPPSINIDNKIRTHLLAAQALPASASKPTAFATSIEWLNGASRNTCHVHSCMVIKARGAHSSRPSVSPLQRYMLTRHEDGGNRHYDMGGRRRSMITRWRSVVKPGMHEKRRILLRSFTCSGVS